MKRLVLCVALFLFAAPAAAQVLSKRAFTRDFAEAVRAHGMTVNVKAELELQVKNKSGTELTMFLDNAYAQYAANPQTHAQIVQRYVGTLLESEAARPVDRARIVPVVKHRSWLAPLPGARKRAEHVFEEINEELVVVYAEDSPRSIRFLVASHLEELGLRKEALRPLALANLDRLLPDIRLRRGAQVAMLSVGGNYEASLLLIDRIWTGGQLQVDGDIVVAVPARDLLFFTGSKNQAGLAQLRDIARKAASEESYSLTDRLFVYRDGRFVRLDGE